MKKATVFLMLTFLFLFSAYSSSSEYETLYKESDWQGLSEKASEDGYSQKRFAYETLAWHGMGNEKRAWLSLNLFLAMSDGKCARDTETKALFFPLAYKEGAYLMMLGRMDDIKTIDDATLCYQAALRMHDQKKADQIFTQWIDGNVSSYRYAVMLAESGMTLQVIAPYLKGMNDDEKLDVLGKLAGKGEDENLLPLLQGLEGKTEDEGKLYGLLAEVAQSCGQRVLARKYREMSGKGN